MSDTIKPLGYVRQDVLMTTSHNFTSGYTVPVYTADALRQARDAALEEAAEWLREAGVPWTAEQMLHELKEKK